VLLDEPTASLDAHAEHAVEAGTHDELMSANGRYAELFTLQAAGYN
jgi:ATP-binding cassette, subfamily B, bacterial